MAETETQERRKTVRDALDAARAWRNRVEQGREEFGAEWAERAFERIAEREAKLRQFDPDMPLLDFHEVMEGDLLSDEEKWCVRWQHHHHGRFYRPSAFELKFFELIELADEQNLDRLAHGWPLEVRAIRAWRGSDMAQRLRTLPLAFDI